MKKVLLIIVIILLSSCMYLRVYEETVPVDHSILPTTDEIETGTISLPKRTISHKYVDGKRVLSERDKKYLTANSNEIICDGIMEVSDYTGRKLIFSGLAYNKDCEWKGELYLPDSESFSFNIYYDLYSQFDDGSDKKIDFKNSFTCEGITLNIGLPKSNILREDLYYIMPLQVGTFSLDDTEYRIIAVYEKQSELTQFTTGEKLVDDENYILVGNYYRDGVIYYKQKFQLLYNSDSVIFNLKRDSYTIFESDLETEDTKIMLGMLYSYFYAENLLKKASGWPG